MDDSKISIGTIKIKCLGSCLAFHLDFKYYDHDMCFLTHFTYSFDEKTLKTPSARLVKVLNYILSELQWCLKAEESVEDVTSHLSNMSLIVAGGAINKSELIHNA
jgi:hypothetical protein